MVFIYEVKQCVVVYVKNFVDYFVDKFVFRKNWFGYNIFVFFFSLNFIVVEFKLV